MTDQAKQTARIEKLDELADLIIDDLVKLAKEGTLTSADRKLILDFLHKNGLNLDPNTVPQELRDMVQRPTFKDEDNDVLPFRNTASR